MSEQRSIEAADPTPRVARRRDVHILAGAWPPAVSGLADHTAILAAGLASRGHDVHVWVPRDRRVDHLPGVVVHANVARWWWRDLRRIGAQLDRSAAPRVILVQWVPHDFGFRALNVMVPAWLLARAAKGDIVLPIIHEAGLPYRPRQWRIFAGAVVHRLMAAMILRAARGHVWITVPWWRERLWRWALGRRLRWQWLPVPSNIVPTGDLRARDAVRARFAPGADVVIGSFGLHGGPSTPPLADALATLLRGPGRVALIIGPEGEQVREAVARRAPDLASRVRTTGPLAGSDVSAHIAACDLMLQPYVDGVSTRRGSAMAAIAHGVPLVTTRGPATEPVWSEEGAALLAGLAPGALDAAGEGLLADASRLSALGRRGREAYLRHFAAELMVERVSTTIEASA